MTARPVRSITVRPRLRVLEGRRPRRRPIAPWMVFTLVVVVAFVGLALARTALDRGAFELAELEARIAQAETENTQLRLEIARLENPARIAPLAEELGFVYPTQRRPLLVSGVGVAHVDDDPRWIEIDRLAAAP